MDSSQGQGDISDTSITSSPNINETLCDFSSLEPLLFSTKQRILILGSSISIQKNGYLPLLQHKLDSICGESHEYLNASLGGTPSEATYCYVHANLGCNIVDFNPTVCIIEKTPNDRLYHYQNMTSSQISDSLSRTEKFLNSLVLHFTNEDCVVMLISMYVKPALVSDSKVIDHLSYLIPLYDQVASSNCILHVNVAEKVITSLDSNEVSSLVLDDVHLTEAGSSLVASIIFDDISSLRTKHNSRFITTKTLLPDLVKSVQLMTLLTGKAYEFSNSLLSFRYDVIKRGEEVIVGSSRPGSLVGFFFLNDPSSGWMQLVTDRGECIDICLFDHYSFMPRLHYLTLPDIGFNSTITIKTIDKPIDYNVAIDAYHKSATFDPTADWALKKWHEPLLNAMNNPQDTSLKPVLFLAQD